jgi:hypothetical protein
MMQPFDNIAVIFYTLLREQAFEFSATMPNQDGIYKIL